MLLGTPRGSRRGAVDEQHQWNPSNVATDWAGNATNTAVNEPVPLDPEF
jgi:hypothetical protein